MITKEIQRITQKLISIIMIVIIIYTLLDTLFINSVCAQTRDTNVNNIYNIDESTYPGYAERLQSLRNSHPNWTFTLLYTDLEWSDALRNETVTEHGKSLVQGKEGEWLCNNTTCNGKPHEGKSWFCASQTAVAYYMDPRNFLTEDKIFQFETLSYLPSIHTEDGVNAILRGTFMENKRICDYYGNSAYGEKTFAQAIMYAAQVANVSPYHIASRIRQEVGAWGSGSSSGTVSGYQGYFNFYNIGAYASADPVINGLIYARDHGWNTPEISIVEGAKWISNNYISIGQDSLYFQKWNVSYLSNLYYHQYQSNIQAPNSESATIYSSYKAIFNNDLTYTSFNFVIPMYKHIPASVSRYPSSSTYVAQNAKVVDNLGIGVYIRQTPAGTPIGIYYNNYELLRIELKAQNVDNKIWDKVMLHDGTIGYIATQYVVENTGISEISKEAYINQNCDLINGPRVTSAGTTAFSQLYNGQIVTIVEQGRFGFDGYSWVKIRLQNGVTGYVQGNFVTEGTYGEKVKVTCDTELALRSAPSGSFITWINPGTIVTRIETATVQSGGYYWDKVITGSGQVGYMAREKYSPAYMLWLTPVNGTTPATTGEKLKVNGDNINVVPGATISDIVAKYPDAVKISGTDNLGTGTRIKVGGQEYTIIKLGDTNGDGIIDVLDLALLKRHLTGKNPLQNEYRTAGILQSTNKDIDVIDLALMKRHLTGSQFISL